MYQQRLIRDFFSNVTLIKFQEKQKIRTADALQSVAGQIKPPAEKPVDLLSDDGDVTEELGEIKLDENVANSLDQSLPTINENGISLEKVNNVACCTINKTKNTTEIIVQNQLPAQVPVVNTSLTCVPTSNLTKDEVVQIFEDEEENEESEIFKILNDSNFQDENDDYVDIIVDIITDDEDEPNEMSIISCSDTVNVDAAIVPSIIKTSSRELLTSSSQKMYTRQLPPTTRRFLYYSCPKCRHKCDSRQDWQQHLQLCGTNKHEQRQPDSAKMYVRIDCPTCKAPQRSYDEWVEHLKQQHDFIEKCLRLVTSVNGNMCKCSICNKCINRRSIVVHMLSHEPHKSFHCTYCNNYKCATQEMAVRHVRRVHLSKLKTFSIRT